MRRQRDTRSKVRFGECICADRQAGLTIDTKPTIFKTRTPWDWWVANTIREHERTKAKQHPVGITGHGAERLASMLASPAEWISPERADGYADDPPEWDANKVSLLFDARLTPCGPRISSLK